MKSQFSQLATTRKGNAGERIVEGDLARKGYTVYSAANVPHEIDFLAIRRGRIIAVEVKTYSRLFSMDATGVDMMDWAGYCILNKQVPVFITWIDPRAGMMYGNWVNELDKHATEFKSKVIFPLKNLPIIRELTPDEIAEFEL